MATWFESDFGLLQGSILSIILFLVFSSDLSADPAKSNLQLLNCPSTDPPNESKYVDNYNLWQSRENIKQLEEELQWDLNIIMEWCQKWKININRQKKNQVILFENKNKKSSKIEITANGSVIKQVKEKKTLYFCIVDEQGFTLK